MTSRLLRNETTRFNVKRVAKSGAVQAPLLSLSFCPASLIFRPAVWAASPAFSATFSAPSLIFPESGTTKAFHPASHYGANPEAILEFNQIQQYRLGQVAYFLEKLKNTVEGETHLLDKTVVLWGSPMSDPNVHNHKRAPLIMIGHGNGALPGNMHVKAPTGTPMANAFLSLLHGLGHEDLDSFGDSTGELLLHSADSTVTAESQGSL